jgi:hypothetical protein
VKLANFPPFGVESASGTEEGPAFELGGAVSEEGGVGSAALGVRRLGRFEDEQASVAVRTPVRPAPAGMESSGEELLKKIRDLEVGQAQLKQEMSKFVPSAAERRRSQSVSPRRGVPPPKAKSPGRRLPGAFEGGPRAWSRGSQSFPHSSPLQREGRAAGAALPERQYSRVLQSLGQAVHILDLDGRIIYW